MQQEFVFAGFGGQGVMFAGQVLAYAAMSQGLEVTWIPSYGPEMRGGTAHCFVVVSDKTIGSPIIERPQVAIVFNIPSLDKYENLVAPGGLLARNASLVQRKTERVDIIDLAVPASEIADSLGQLRLVNIAMLGAVLAARPVISLDTVRLALDEHIPAHHRDKLPLNLQALQKGAEFTMHTLGQPA